MEDTALNSTMQTAPTPVMGGTQPVVAGASQQVVQDTNSTIITPTPQPTSTPSSIPNDASVPDINTANSADRLAELRKNLDDLLSSGSDVGNTSVQPGTPAPVQNPVVNSTDMPAPTVDQSIHAEQTYTQTVTDLPNLNSVATPQADEDISKIIDRQPIEESVPVANPIASSTLSDLMPGEKKPKAQDRAPKANSLAKPRVVVSGNPDDSLKKTDDTVQPQEAHNDRSSNTLEMSHLLSEAINRHASDLHISVGYPPILRIDGSLVDMDEKVLTPEDVENLIFSVLTDEKKELLEVNREIDFAYLHEGSVTARFRVNAYYTMKNLAAAFRLIPARIRTIEELSLPPIYHQLTQLKQGLILVTGPTGHGKSTTLAAMLEDINRTRFVHMVTIEDPIEYVFEGKKALIDQREMNDDTHSWPIALRSALRQDPDVILVGEMRDYETIASAITLAETGHLVFATLHTNSAAQTVDRIIDVFPENQQQQVRSQIANSLRAVIAQRLIPLDKGGRRAVSEIMINNSALANLIREGKTHQIDNIIRTSADVGMIYLEKSLVALVREGVISVQRAQEYAVHPEEVLRLLKG